jgi:hypothetical protein
MTTETPCSRHDSALAKTLASLRCHTVARPIGTAISGFFYCVMEALHESRRQKAERILRGNSHPTGCSASHHSFTTHRNWPIAGPAKPR